MPKVRFLQSVAGADMVCEAGQVVDLPADVAVVWADGVRAEWVAEPKRRKPRRAAQETTMAVPDVEQAVR